jgi:hypothetical protein
VKLEVLGDPQSLYPNVIETIAAAKTLVAEGFQVMVYTSDDPIVAKQLEDIGCVAIMPLASLIGSGMGILNPWNLQLVMERVKVPVIVDAGVGTASDAAIAMELGCHGVLMNTAIAGAKDPVLMASAMKKGVEAGREAYLAGRMPKKLYSASPSSPTAGIISSTRPKNLLLPLPASGKGTNNIQTPTTPPISPSGISAVRARGPRLGRAAARHRHTAAALRHSLCRPSARPRAGLWPHRADHPGNRLRHGRQYRCNRAGASRERLSGAGSAHAWRGQSAQTD